MADTGSLAGKRLLVVEDDYYVATYLAEILTDAGAIVAGPIGRVTEAVDYVRREGHELDGAVLDVNLNGEASYPIADALVAAQVAFVFTTGYGANALAPEYRGFARCEKPFREEALVGQLVGLVG